MGTPRWTAGDYPAKRSICPTRSRGQRPPVEHLADDARPLQHGALLEVQPVQAGCQQGGDGAGDGGADQVGGRRPVAAGLAEHALVDQLGDQLLDEQRVASGPLGDARQHLGRGPGTTEQLAHQPGALVLAQGLQRDRRGAGGAGPPARALVQQLRPGQPDQQDGRVAGGTGHVLEEVEQRRRSALTTSGDDRWRDRFAMVCAQCATCRPASRLPAGPGPASRPSIQGGPGRVHWRPWGTPKVSATWSGTGTAPWSTTTARWWRRSTTRSPGCGCGRSTPRPSAPTSPGPCSGSTSRWPGARSSRASGGPWTRPTTTATAPGSRG